MRKNSKNKGSKGERTLTKVLQDWTGLEFKRSPQSGGLRGHVMDYTVGDIICTDRAFRNKVFPFSIEAKNYGSIDFSTLLERPNPSSRTNTPVNCEIDLWWKQTVEDALRGEKLPILFIRFNNLPKEFFYVVLDRKHAKNLLIPKDRLVTKKYVITTTQKLAELKWNDFYLKALDLWTNMYG